MTYIKYGWNASMGSADLRPSSIIAMHMRCCIDWLGEYLLEEWMCFGVVSSSGAEIKLEFE